MADFVPLQKRELHQDVRGDLFEMLRFKDEAVPGEGYIYCITIVPGERRGDHYHERKIEWMSCVHGEITMLAEHPDGRQQKIVMRAGEPMCVRFDTDVAHAFVNTGNEVAVAAFYGSVQHDPAHPDLIPKVIDFKEKTP